jgi:hypothetical protein
VRATDEYGLVVGVDTHRDTHSAAVCDRAGKALAVRQFSADPDGYAAMLARVPHFPLQGINRWRSVPRLIGGHKPILERDHPAVQFVPLG